MDINPLLKHIVYSHADWWDTTPWLEANVGEFNQTWYKLGRDIGGVLGGMRKGDEYRFLREQDAVLFMLKWA